MIVISEQRLVSSPTKNELIKSRILSRKEFKIVSESDKELIFQPSFGASLPSGKRKKATMNYLYSILFLEDCIIIRYFLKPIILYGTITIALLSIALFVGYFFYPKLFGVAVISILALVFSTVINFISFFRARSFFNRDVLIQMI